MLAPEDYPDTDGAITSAEILSWAYDEKARWPHQDWHLMLGHSGWALLMFDLIEDNCPQRRTCLNALYVTSASIVPLHQDDLSPDVAEQRALSGLLLRAEQRGHPWLLTWAARTRELVGHPERFHYGKWCSGGYARRPIDRH